MDCKKAYPYLQSVADGECDGRVAKRVIEHLAACPGCMEDVESRKRFRLALRSRTPRLPSPPFLESRILQSIKSQEVATPHSRFFSLRPLQFATVTLLVVATFWIGSQFTLHGRGQLRAETYAHQVVNYHAVNETPRPLEGEDYKMTRDVAQVAEFFRERSLAFSVQTPQPEGLRFGGVSHHVYGNLRIACLMFGGEASICFFTTRTDQIEFPEEGLRQLADGTPVFCRRMMPDMGLMEEFGVAIWRQGDMCYAVVSASPDDELLRYAQEFKNQIAVPARSA